MLNCRTVNITKYRYCSVELQPEMLVCVVSFWDVIVGVMAFKPVLSQVSCVVDFADFGEIGEYRPVSS